MSKITSSPELDRVPEKEFKRFVAIYLQEVSQIVNGNLDFSQNIRGTINQITFASINTDTVLVHGLGKVPSGYLVFKRSNSMIVYDGLTSNTSTNIYLRSSALGTITVFVF